MALYVLVYCIREESDRGWFAEIALAIVICLALHLLMSCATEQHKVKTAEDKDSTLGIVPVEEQLS